MNKGKRSLQIFAALALSGFASIGMANPPDQANPPDRVEFSIGPILDPDSSAACGFDVMVTFAEKIKVKVFADESVHFHSDVELVYSNPRNGKKLIETVTMNQIWPPDKVIDDADAGTRTIIFTTIVNGVPFKWRQPGTGVLLLDAGTVTFVGTLVLGLYSGEFLSFSNDLGSLHGPHPSLFTSTDDLIAMGCGAIN